MTIWNGTSLAADVLPDFLAKLPLSRHEVQTIDVHPVLGVCAFALSSGLSACLLPLRAPGAAD